MRQPYFNKQKIWYWVSRANDVMQDVLEIFRAGKEWTVLRTLLDNPVALARVIGSMPEYTVWPDDQLAFAIQAFISEGLEDESLAIACHVTCNRKISIAS